MKSNGKTKSNSKSSQLAFAAKGLERPRSWFGGTYLKNSHAKTKRPLSSKLPIHVVLRSSRAKGDLSFRHPRYFAMVQTTIRDIAHRYGIRLYETANVGNHLHLLVKLPHVRRWKPFIRELCGTLARKILGLKGRNSTKFEFWDQRPFTRIVDGWNRAYRIVKDYIVMNKLEGAGLISRLKPPAIISSA